MKRPVITISREFGSGGRIIGEAIAKKFDFAVYDKTIINMSAEKSGLSVDYVEENDQRLTRSVLFQIAVTGSLPPWLNDAPEAVGAGGKSVYSAQAAVIKELAEKGGCVIIGRCADHILRDYDNCISVFICGDTEDKLSRCIKEYKMPPNGATAEMMRRDKERADYYTHYTNNIWGKAENYDICINSSTFGVDGSVEIISKAIESMMAE